MTNSTKLSLKGKHILVTGGAGFIGSHLVDRIIQEKPASIIVVDNFFLGSLENLDAAIQEYPELTIIDTDAANYDAMKAVFDKYPIDVVFHLAVIPLPVSLERPIFVVEQQVNMTVALCKLLAEKRYTTLIHCSSSEVYGTAKHAPMDESHPLDPETPYAAAKAAADHIALSYHHTFGYDVAVVRPFNQYGPRQNKKDFSGVIPRTIECVRAGGDITIFGDGEQTRDFLYVTDTVDAILAVYEEPKTRGIVVNIGSGKEVSINNLMHLLGHHLHYKKEIIHTAPRPGDVRRHLAGITLAKQLLGWTPKVSFEEGLAQTVAWYVAQDKK